MADASGFSFAFAILVITLGRVVMQIPKFFRDPIKAAEERGRENTIDRLSQMGAPLTQEQLDLLRTDDKEGSKEGDKPAGER